MSAPRQTSGGNGGRRPAKVVQRRWPRAQYAANGLPAHCAGCGARVRLTVVQPFIWFDPDTGYPHECKS